MFRIHSLVAFLFIFLHCACYAQLNRSDTDFIVTKEFLDQNPNAVFIFGDNRRRVGYGGAASLRDHPQTYGFITKKNPDNLDESFFHPESYHIDFTVQLLLHLSSLA